MEIRLINPDMKRDFDDPQGVIKQILMNRNITETVDEFFNLSWDDVQSPYDLDFIEEAANRILYALENNESIAMIVDPDVDGFTSSALMTNYIKRLKPDVTLTHLFHDTKIHGLDDKKIMKKLRDDIAPDLLIIPDASGSEAQYNALTELGINIVVIDHHPDMCAAPDPRVIVVNNQQSENYHNENLSGVGVVWQVLRVLDDITGNEFANDWLDITAMGLVADVMNLKSRETRFLVQEGLDPKSVKNPFMLHYAAVNSYVMPDPRYNPEKISWNIAPIFNAVVRVGDTSEAEIIFKALLEDAGEVIVPSGKRGHVGEPVPLVEEAMRQATNAKSRQTRRQNKLVEMIEGYIAEHGLQNNQIIHVKIDELDENERSMTGVIASKLVSAYGRPVLLSYKEDKTKPIYKGSTRTPDDVPLFLEFKKQCNDSGLFIYASGHESAHGHSFHEDDFDAIVEYFNKKYEGQSTDIRYNVDYLFEADDPNLADVIMALDEYKHWWGKGIDRPLIGVVNAKCTIHNMELMSAQKNPTLKFKLDHGVAGIKFHSSQAEFDSFCKRGGQLLDSNTANNFTLIGETSINRWRDTVTPQLLLQYYEHKGYDYEF